MERSRLVRLERVSDSSGSGTGAAIRAVVVAGARARLTLRPYAVYSFRVSAINELGLSDPSLSTQSQFECATAARAPDSNPLDVRVEGQQPNSLDVFWSVRSRFLIEH